jgi:hypothetical protein
VATSRRYGAARSGRGPTGRVRFLPARRS